MSNRSQISLEMMRTKVDTIVTIAKENAATTGGKYAIWHGRAGKSVEVSTLQVVEVDAVEEVVMEDAAGEVTEVTEIKIVQMQIMHPFLASTNRRSETLCMPVSPENALFQMVQR